DVAFHELMHWSERRTGWEEHPYAVNELRAELGAVYLAAEVGIPLAGSMKNHAKYLAGWIEALKGNSRLIFQVSSAASKGADYVLSFSRKVEPFREILVTA